MKIRRIRIWLSRGWYRVVYSVSFLVLSFFCSCSSSRTAAKEKTEGSKGVETSKDKEPVDSTKTDVSVIRMEEFQGLGIETPEIRLMYGVPSPIRELKQAVPQDTAKSTVAVSGSKPQAGDMISGIVRDENGPFQMANITERDSLYRIVAHAVSDENGKFAFKLVNPANRLSVTFVGYEEAITEITGSFFETTLVEQPALPKIDIMADVQYVTMYGPPAVLNTTNSSQTMRLMYGVQPPADKENSYPLIVLNGKIINVDKEKLDAFDFEKDINSKEKVAALLDVDEKTIFASCLMTDPSSITIWGTRGRNGVFEVVDKKRYRRYKSYNDYQLLK